MGTDEVRFWAVYQCSKCHKAVLAEGQAAPKVQRQTVPKHRNIVRLYPGHRTLDVSLPEGARRYLKQAIDTLFAPDASVVMSASAVDAMLKDKGYTKGSLHSRIDEAVKDHLLTEGMGKWAHQVRLEANAVRHADLEEDPPSDADAAATLEFAKALGDFLYVFTARIEKGLADADKSAAANLEKPKRLPAPDGPM